MVKYFLLPISGALHPMPYSSLSSLPYPVEQGSIVGAAFCRDLRPPQRIAVEIRARKTGSLMYIGYIHENIRKSGFPRSGAGKVNFGF